MGVMKEIDMSRTKMCYSCSANIDTPEQCEKCKMHLNVRGQEVIFVPSTGKIEIDDNNKH